MPYKIYSGDIPTQELNTSYIAHFFSRVSEAHSTKSVSYLTKVSLTWRLTPTIPEKTISQIRVMKKIGVSK